MKGREEGVARCIQSIMIITCLVHGPLHSVVFCDHLRLKLSQLEVVLLPI